MATSSARRVAKLLTKALALRPSNQPVTLTAWALAFGLDHDPSKKRVNSDIEDETAALIRELRAEIRHVSESSRGTEADAEVQLIVAAALTATASHQYQASWEAVRTTHLKPEIMAGWRWAAIHLPAAEEDIDSGALNELQELLDSAETVVDDADVPIELRAFIRKQLQAIRRAVRGLHVSGVGPLTDAINQGMGELVSHRDVIAHDAEKSPAGATKAMKVMATTWNKAAEVSGQAEKIAKGFAFIGQAYDKVKPLVEALVGIIVKD